MGAVEIPLLFLLLLTAPVQGLIRFVKAVGKPVTGVIIGDAPSVFLTLEEVILTWTV